MTDKRNLFEELMSGIEDMAAQREALEGEHQIPQQRQAWFTTYLKLSEWVAFASPMAMNMQWGRVEGVTEPVMIVDYIPRNGL